MRQLRVAGATCGGTNEASWPGWSNSRVGKKSAPSGTYRGLGSDSCLSHFGFCSPRGRTKRVRRGKAKTVGSIDDPFAFDEGGGGPPEEDYPFEERKLEVEKEPGENLLVSMR